MKLLVSATRKSSGKTAFCVGFLAALRRRGIPVQPFKKGPDYIDPQWLSLAADKPCYNLDFHVQTDNEITTFFDRRRQDAFAVVEANKGLYDGVSSDGCDSNAALAYLLNLPVLLVLDCNGTTRGIAPLLQGYLNFDNRIKIIGVVLNKVGGDRHRNKLETIIRMHVGIPVKGAIMRDTRMELLERHLGLVPENERGDAATIVEKMRAAVEEQVNCGEVLGLAFHSDKKDKGSMTSQRNKVILSLSDTERVSVLPQSRFRLGIFRDQAFGFYYPDDLESLQQHGAELVFIDSLHDINLPPVDGLLIGGGFPETQASLLQANCSLREQVKQAIEAGLPVYAECGGLMYLTRSITWQGQKYAMSDVLPADTIMHDTPQGRGYTRVYETEAMLWGSVQEGESNMICGHEFHYSEIIDLPQSTSMAFDMLRGGGIANGKDGIVYKNLLATYLHQRSTQANPWTKRFAEFILACKSGND